MSLIEYDEHYGGKVYGHSVEDDYNCVSPERTLVSPSTGMTANQFLYNREGGPPRNQLSSYLQHETEICEEEEEEGATSAGADMALSQLEKGRLASCLESLQEILGHNTPPKEQLTDTILNCSFDVEKALDAVLNADAKPQQERRERKKDVVGAKPVTTVDAKTNAAFSLKAEPSELGAEKAQIVVAEKHRPAKNCGMSGAAGNKSGEMDFADFLSEIDGKLRICREKDVKFSTDVRDDAVPPTHTAESGSNAGLSGARFQQRIEQKQFPTKESREGALAQPRSPPGLSNLSMISKSVQNVGDGTKLRTEKMSLFAKLASEHAGDAPLFASASPPAMRDASVIRAVPAGIGDATLLMAETPALRKNIDLLIETKSIMEKDVRLAAVLPKEQGEDQMFYEQVPSMEDIQNDEKVMEEMAGDMCGLSMTAGVRRARPSCFGCVLAGGLDRRRAMRKQSSIADKVLRRLCKSVGFFPFDTLSPDGVVLRKQERRRL